MYYCLFLLIVVYVVRKTGIHFQTQTQYFGNEFGWINDIKSEAIVTKEESDVGVFCGGTEYFSHIYLFILII